jgi:hypothetical protein
MYTLTLTRQERQAIDFVGHRYAHGDDLYDVLTDAEWEDDCEWDDDCDITFTLAEYLAWDINSIGNDSEFRFDLFSGELCEKITLFCDGIV